MQAQAQTLVSDCGDEIDEGTVSDRVREMYLNDEKKVVFAEQDIGALGDLLAKMTHCQPEDRLPTHDILKHQWFVKVSSHDLPWNAAS